MQSILQRVMDSVLAADIGSVWTRVLLIDRVNGEYRFVARGDVPSTIAPPHADVTVGVRAAIREIELNTGRRLLDEEDQLITPEGAEGNGVDFFLVTSSAAQPLKIGVAGLVGRVSTASARRAALGTYSEINHSISLDADEGRWGHPRGTLGVVEQLTQNWPDVMVLAGGTEGSNDEDILDLIDAIVLGLESSPDNPPFPIIYAGNSELSEEVRARVGESTMLMISENVRPTLQEERLRTTGRLLDQQYRSRNLARLPGIESLRNWSNVDPLSTVEAFSRVIQYLALRHEKRVLGVDVGGDNISIVATFPNRITQSLVRTDLGLTCNTESLIDQVGAERLAAWVPGFRSPEELVNQFLNLSLYPPQVPISRETLLLLQGATREALRLAFQDAAAQWPRPYPGLNPAFDIIVGTGGAIRGAPRPEQAMSIILDAIQPVGITQVLRDHISLAPAIGALADVAPQVAADLIEAQEFESLGIVITPVGRAAPGDEILRFQMIQGNGQTEGAVEYGQLFRLPTPQETHIRIRPSRHIDIGFGPGVGTTLSSAGDSVGFVIDARGRPLSLPTEFHARRQRIEEWLLYVGA